MSATTSPSPRYPVPPDLKRALAQYLRTHNPRRRKRRMNRARASARRARRTLHWTVACTLPMAVDWDAYGAWCSEALGYHAPCIAYDLCWVVAFHFRTEHDAILFRLRWGDALTFAEGVNAAEIMAPPDRRKRR